MLTPCFSLKIVKLAIGKHTNRRVSHRAFNASPPSVTEIEILGFFQQVNITPTHDIHLLGEVGPVSELVGLPIIVYRHTREPWMNRAEDASLYNQNATYLMFEQDGFASPMYVLD